MTSDATPEQCREYALDMLGQLSAICRASGDVTLAKIIMGAQLQGELLPRLGGGGDSVFGLRGEDRRLG